MVMTFRYPVLYEDSDINTVDEVSGMEGYVRDLYEGDIPDLQFS